MAFQVARIEPGSAAHVQDSCRPDIPLFQVFTRENVGRVAVRELHGTREALFRARAIISLSMNMLRTYQGFMTDSFARRAHVAPEAGRGSGILRREHSRKPLRNTLS